MVNIKVKSAKSDVRIKVEKRLKWFEWLSFIALLVSGYLIYLHYETSAGAICDINDFWNCDKVNKSPYSELFGIPVAILGAAYYLLMFLLAHGILKNIRFTRWSKLLRPLNMFWGMFALNFIAILFTGYLTYIELFVLKAVCMFCLTQQVIIIVSVFFLLSILSVADQDKKENPNVCEFC